MASWNFGRGFGFDVTVLLLLASCSAPPADGVDSFSESVERDVGVDTFNADEVADILDEVGIRVDTCEDVTNNDDVFVDDVEDVGDIPEEGNSSTQCGPPTATATNCESIPNQKNPQDATCNNDGFCKVKECSIGYHLKQAQQLHDACNINSVQACGAVNKNPINCLEIENLAPATPPTQDNPNPPAHVECSTEGKCHIKQCDKTFHILRADQNTPHDTCVQNSAIKCGKPTQTQNEVIDCTITPNATSTTCVENGSCHMGNCSGFSCDTNLEYSQAIDCTGEDNSCRFVCTQEGYAFCTLSRVVCLKLTYGLTEDECDKCPNTCSQGQLCYKSAPNEYKCTNP